jgi:hypothetical protein
MAKLKAVVSISWKAISGDNRKQKNDDEFPLVVFLESDFKEERNRRMSSKFGRRKEEYEYSKKMAGWIS